MPSAWSQPGRFNNRQRAPRLEDLLPLRKFKSGVFYNERFIGPPLTFAEHWIEIFKKNGDPVKLRKLCLSYDDKSGEFKGGCPYCDLLKNSPRICTIQNSINRKAQRNEPRHRPKPIRAEQAQHKMSDGQRYYFKAKDSDSWTPVDVVRLAASASQRINDMAATNTRPDKNGTPVVYGPEDQRYGFDVQIKYDSAAPPATAYFVQKEKKNRLSDTERAYLVHKLDVEQPESPTEAQKEAERMLGVLVEKPVAEGESKSSSKGKDKHKDKNKHKSRGYLADLSGSNSDAGSFAPSGDSVSNDPRKSNKSSSRHRSSSKDRAKEKSSSSRHAHSKTRHRSSSKGSSKDNRHGSSGNSRRSSSARRLDL